METNDQIKKINENILETSNKIQETTNNQTKIIEYHKYKNNGHIAISVLSFIGIGFITIKSGISPINSSILSLLSASTLGFGTNYFFKIKRKKLEKENPKINFQNYDIDKNYQEITELFERKFSLIDELENITKNNKICNDIEPQQTKIYEPLNEEVTYKEHVKVLTLTKERKK